MRVRVRAATVAAGLAAALTTALPGCVTVHGERAEVPAVSPREAAAVVAHYAEVSNDANRAYDAELNATVETGALAAVDQAAHRAHREVHPGGNPDPAPVEFSDARYHIPRQAGWPRYFVADVHSGRTEHRWLLVFTRDGIDREWRASHLSPLPPQDVPEFRVDADGYAEAVTGDDPALALAPEELSAGYTAYLASGEGPYAEGPYTSGVRQRRQETELSHVTQYQDLPAENAAYAPVGLRTADGGALVFFTARHAARQTWAQGETPVVDPYAEALMEGTATRSVTTERLGLQAALVPAATAGGGVTVLSRWTGLVAARGD